MQVLDERSSPGSSYIFLPLSYVLVSYFEIGESGVSQACRHVKDKIRNDKKLERKIAKIEKKLNAFKCVKNEYLTLIVFQNAGSTNDQISPTKAFLRIHQT
ncbi:MAG: hypothetical protein JRF31_07700 [Deltaproteobacteria bacterium]|nr:hypothetical protein [Deltaproteobacteria bacterium]